MEFFYNFFFFDDIDIKRPARYGKLISMAYINPFPINKLYTLPNCKSLQTTMLNFMKMAESSPYGIARYE